MLRILQNPAVLFCSLRPKFYWDVVGTHLPLALATGTPLLLSWLAPYQWLPLIGCTFLKLTGIPCPFCGFTRAIWAISAGDWAYATCNCPLAWLVYMILVVVFAYNAGALLFGVKPRILRILRPGSNPALWVAAIGIILILSNWVYRLSLGLK